MKSEYTLTIDTQIVEAIRAYDRITEKCRTGEISPGQAVEFRRDLAIEIVDLLTDIVRDTPF